MAACTVTVLLSFDDASLLEIDDFFKDHSPVLPPPQTTAPVVQEPPASEARIDLDAFVQPEGPSNAEMGRITKGKGIMMEEEMAESLVAPREPASDPDG